MYRNWRENPDKIMEKFLNKKLKHQDLHQHSQGQKQGCNSGSSVSDQMLMPFSVWSLTCSASLTFQVANSGAPATVPPIFPSRFQPRKAS